MTRTVRFSVWFIVILLASFAVGYMSWAKATFNWPYDDTFYPYPEKNDESPSTSFSSADRSLGTPGDYVGWQTYRNEEYRFEINFPIEFDSIISIRTDSHGQYKLDTPINRANQVSFDDSSSQSFYGFIITVHVNSEKLTLQEFSRANWSYVNPFEAARVIEEFKTDSGLQGIYFVDLPDMVPQSYAVIKKGDIMVEFHNIIGGIEDDKFLRILKSFR